ncbi:uncharacterized protein PGTG_17388 [Puccinia graminis f. sp. tritici CRL 75-36-700-3]|uniref:DUF4110 domain-containing protein n=1 Tax=Puccinia graminis f. sp. tritici (strain CRL 75-36-700-3 / race SCCL) TaxID=418459 RepID=E3L4F7_PUCGT|nr:uncharacterized protein PGTG_17388 [Puccinia graminis f. sp. tritici CRL 75-36-700-3]EFP91432.2 hypothetical protein PGTG_17388 [Puccinia graminis f. sp. tritici CRL 75-36-700-3]
MGKAKKAKASNKAAVKASKKEKQAKKVEQKSKKQLALEAAAEEEDLLTTLEEFRAKWEAEHKVTEDVIDGPPSRRANASFTPDPNQPYIWLFGGEFFNGTTAHFYNDLYRYSPDKNEWRRYSSPTFPGPRSTHQMVATPAGGGKLWLFGGEFASSNQTTFHHYRDMWCFDLASHSWERIETKVQPSARSGHRMVVWKQWIILFGGFHDVGVRTNYLHDLWFFDMMEYKWQQITSRDNERWPSPRSGFSLLSIPEGIILHGKSISSLFSLPSGTQRLLIAKGVALDDTFFLKLDPANPDWLKKLKWEKRKRVGQVPSLRSGSTMVNWVNKAMAVGFGGVLDLEDNEEGLVSEFYNDLYAYQLSGTGRWMSLNLKKPKKKKGKDGPNGKKKSAKNQDRSHEKTDDNGVETIDAIPEEDEAMELDEEDRLEEARLKADQRIRDEIARSKLKANSAAATKANDPAQTAENQLGSAAETQDPSHDEEDPEKTIPLARFNPMLAILKNTLYIYGGIYESGDKEYTLQSFYALALDKLDRYICLRDDDIHNHEWYDESEGGSDEEDSGSDGSSSDTDSQSEEPESIDKLETEHEQLPIVEDPSELVDVVATQVEQEELKKKVEAFMGVAKSSERSIEEVMSTPLPGESLKLFYDRTREYWTQKAHETSQHRGKELRRDGFSHAEERYSEYKPLLDEIERIQAEAGIEASDVQRRTGPSGVGGGGPAQDSRHRR